MTQTTLTAMRHAADVMASTDNHGYRLEVFTMPGRWTVKMFDLTLARAEAYAQYFDQARIVDRSGVIVDHGRSPR